MAVSARSFLENDADRQACIQDRNNFITWLKSVGLDGELEQHERDIIHTHVGGVSASDASAASWQIEGAAVLAWALGLLELPAYDVQVDLTLVYKSLGLWKPDCSPKYQLPLRNIDDMVHFARRMLTIHWRLRQYIHVRREAVDMAEIVQSDFGQMMKLTLDGLRLKDRDLEIDGFAMTKLPEEALCRCTAIVQERHRAASWVLGKAEKYSETDTST